MALYRSAILRLARYFFCIIIIVLGIGENRHARTAAEAYKYGVNKVDICPQNKTEWKEASRRLNCSYDSKNPLNRYHCLPVHDLSSLMEFCYTRTRPQVVKGLCMVYVQEINSLNSYNCTTFDVGCPDMFYLSDETYKYPRCMEINTISRCYFAESSCKLATTTSSDITSVTRAAENSSSPTSTDNAVAIAISTSVVFLVLTCIVVAFIYKRRKKFCRRKDINFDQKDKDPLLPNSEIAEIERQGLTYLLQEFPSDIKPKPIAKILNVPPEILSWSMERRQQFVESMNKGSVNEYSGRGIVIGTADTGKMNLVEKLQRKNNLRTESTRGIKKYSNESMLDAKECTIIVANDKKRVEKPEGNEPSLTSFDQIELKDVQTGEYLIAKQTNLDTEPPVSNLRDPSSDVVLKVNKSQILQPLVDICCCVRPKNKTVLKRLNLLDFDGKNACHRIFFSSRAFYIVLIDISKGLDRPMDEGVYSDWTYGEYIRYWLRFIHTYGSVSAPVILVASHLGSKDADKDKTVLLKYFEEICDTLPETLVKHLDKKRAFLVEETSDKNLKDLQGCIASTLNLQDHWGKGIPKTWTKIESVLDMKRSFRMCSISSILEDLMRIDDQLINNIGELITVLMYFHETGVILFRKDLDEIILDVQWFADAFKSIVVNDKHNVAQFKELNGYGLLSTQLLNDFWSNSDLTFHENRDKLVKHMVKLDMIAELNSTLWYVPCMNKQQYTKSILENCSVSSTLCFVFEILPIDIFHRLVATCINKHNMTLWQSEEKYCVYNNVTLLKCENTALIVLFGIRGGKENADEEYPHSIEIQAINRNDCVGTIDSSLCSGIKQIICEVLSDLTQTFQTDKEPFHLGYRCVRTPYDDLPEGHIILEKDISTDRGIKCSKCKQNQEIEVDSLIGHWKNDRLTGNDDVEASIPFSDAIDKGQHDSKPSISSSYKRDILSENEGSKEYKDEISHPGKVGHPVPHKQSHQDAEPLRGTQDWLSWKYHEELRTPEYWTKYTCRNTLKDWNLNVRTNVYSLIDVDQVVSNSIERAFKSTMGMKTIKSIQRVENVDLFQKYAEECQRLFRKAYVEGNFVPLDKIKSSLGPVNIMKRLDPSMTQHTYPEINEYYFFHAPNAQHVDDICSQGLDSRLANSGRLGRGVNGAEVASRSAGFVGPNSFGYYPLFLIRMCLGDVYLTGQGGNYKRPPIKTNSSKGGGTQRDLFDSVVANGGDFSEREFVVYDRNQSYPEYLIWYE